MTLNKAEERCLLRMLDNWDLTPKDVVLLDKNIDCRFETDLKSTISKPPKGYYRCDGFCNEGIYASMFTKRITMDRANTSSFLLVCMECGHVWQDVDHISIPEAGDCSSRVNGSQLKPNGGGITEDDILQQQISNIWRDSPQ